MLPYEREPAFYEIVHFAKNRYKDCQVLSKYRERDKSTIVLGRYGFQYPIEVPFDIFVDWDYDSFQGIVFQDLEAARKDLDNITRYGYGWCGFDYGPGVVAIIPDFSA